MTLTFILIGMTVLISYRAFNDQATKYKLAFHPVSVAEFGEWYRFLTSGFIHGSWQHLILNMYVFYLFGDHLETIFTEMLFSPLIGRLVFLLFYLSAIVVADIPTFFKYRNNSGYSSLGASGATSALMMAFILFYPWEWFILPPLPGIIFAIAFLWYSSYMARRGSDLIAHNAHLWGAVYGIVFMVALAAFKRPRLLEFFFARLMEGPSMPNF